MPPNERYLNADFDAYRLMTVPAGPASAGAAPVAGAVVYNFGNCPGPAVLTMMAMGVNGTIPGNVVWVIDTMANSEGASLIEPIVKARRCFIGDTIANIPVTIPCRVSLYGLDGGAAFDAVVAWKIMPQSSVSSQQQREQQVRLVNSIAVGGFAPVDPAVGNDLLFPIASELDAGLITPNNLSGFGWRPNMVNIRKVRPNDSIIAYIAQGALIAGIPTFGVINIAPGTSEWTGVVDPSWSGGLIIGNAAVAPSEKILLTWWKE